MIDLQLGAHYVSSNVDPRSEREPASEPKLRPQPQAKCPVQGRIGMSGRDALSRSAKHAQRADGTAQERSEAKARNQTATRKPRADACGPTTLRGRQISERFGVDDHLVPCSAERHHSAEGNGRCNARGAEQPDSSAK